MVQMPFGHGYLTGAAIGSRANDKIAVLFHKESLGKIYWFYLLLAISLRP